MQLRTRPSLWQKTTTSLPVFPRLNEKLQTQVLLVGAGISGALIAWSLIEAGLQVAMIDRHQPGTGSSAASTGLLQYEIDTPLYELIERRGEADAVTAYQLGVRAIDYLGTVSSLLPRVAGFSRRDSLYLASEPYDVEALRMEYQARKRHGFRVEYLERSILSGISSINAEGAIYSLDDAQLDPLKFTLGLLELSVAHGLKLYGESAVEHIDHRDESVTVFAGGGEITCEHLIYTTGYDSHPFLDRSVGALHSSYVVSSRPVEGFSGWPAGALIWETARLYFYARQSGDGRIIIGGEDTDYADDHQTQALIEEKEKLLCQRFSELFPRINFEPEMSWAGTFGESEDGLAYIGKADPGSREYFCLGYGGNGITFSAIAAELLRDLILDRPNPAARIFSFQR